MPTAVIRVAETVCKAWEEVKGQFVRPLGSAPALAGLHDQLVPEFGEPNIFIENCLFPDCERQQECVPRYRFAHFSGPGIGNRRHLERVN